MIPPIKKNYGKQTKIMFSCFCEHETNGGTYESRKTFCSLLRMQNVFLGKPETIDLTKEKGGKQRQICKNVCYNGEKYIGIWNVT